MIVEIKKTKTWNVKEILSSLKNKFIISFVLIYILLLFFWYYLSCFCAVYPNTQAHLISDTLISFTFSLLYPFLVYLIPGIFRIPSLNTSKRDKKYMYNLSKIFQLI